jgi:hypothetical protein
LHRGELGRCSRPSASEIAFHFRNWQDHYFDPRQIACSNHNVFGQTLGTAAILKTAECRGPPSDGKGKILAEQKG